jgi:hypothetical protein
MRSGRSTQRKTRERGANGTPKTNALTLPLCSVEAPPVVILLLAAIDAPESSEAARTIDGATTMGAAVRRPMEREKMAAAMRSGDEGRRLGSAFARLASCNWDGGCEE